MASEIAKFASKLKRLERTMNRRNAISEVIADNLLHELNTNLSRIPQGVDQFEIGGANDVGHASASGAHQTATLRWSGNQIWYLEFGTGAVGLGQYQDPIRMAEANGYTPRPWHWDGSGVSSYWRSPPEYADATGRRFLTNGWAPYAPFFNTMLVYQNGQFNSAIEKAVNELTESLL